MGFFDAYTQLQPHCRHDLSFFFRVSLPLEFRLEVIVRGCVFFFLMVFS